MGEGGHGESRRILVLWMMYWCVTPQHLGRNMRVASFSQRCWPPKILWKNCGYKTNVENKCVANKCGKRMCENVWESVRMCASKCGCAKSVIFSNNVPTYGTYPNVEVTSSPRLFNKLHCSLIPTPARPCMRDIYHTYVRTYIRMYTWYLVKRSSRMAITLSTTCRSLGNHLGDHLATTWQPLGNHLAKTFRCWSWF